MHKYKINQWQHHHDFAVIHEKGERRTKQVLVLTAVTMILEIVAGTLFGSMALLADGWHMSTHTAAFLITIFVYNYARKHKDNPQFTFGTGKVSVLGGFASAIALAAVAFMMSAESVERFFNPHEIQFEQAIGVAVLGLVVNLISALLLKDYHSHDHNHHQDHNLKSAYFHVLADALTSLLAIVALFAGKYFGWIFLDPIMGLVGAAIIIKWALSLLKETSPVLLDKTITQKTQDEIKQRIEADSDNKISDLHIWKVGPIDCAVVISLVTHFPKPVSYYKSLLKDMECLSHITIEVNQGEDESCQ